MINAGRFAAIIFAGASLAACAGKGGDDAACLSDDEIAASYERPSKVLTVQAAEDADTSEVIEVRGSLLRKEAEAARICTAVDGASPPRCVQPSLEIRGRGDVMRALDNVESVSHDGTRYLSAERVTIPGHVEDDALVLRSPCSSERVIEHFEEETGQTLERDFFISNSKADVLSFEALADQGLARKRAGEWGRFAITVLFSRKGEAVQETYEQVTSSIGDADPVEPDERGIVWAELPASSRPRAGRWLALKEYDDGVVLQWLAGDKRQVDRRWKRLEAILSGLD